MIHQKNIRCTLRGCITRSDFNEIRHSIEQDFGKLDETSELIIFFKGDCDLRLRINKNGCLLSLKKTINRKRSARQETELSFSLGEISKVIDFLTQLGFTKGLFSYYYRYDAVKLDYSISIKFQTKIGDFFELGKLVHRGEGFKKIYEELLKLSKTYALNSWTQKVYKKIIGDSWDEVHEEPLLINKKLHPLIKKVINESKYKKKAIFIDRSVSTILKNRSNDYTELEKIFKIRTGTDLLDWKPGDLNNYGETVSIIIPTFNSLRTLKLTLRSIEKQKINKNQRKHIEVIVVDDGSNDGTENFLKRRKFAFKFRYVKQNHLGRVYARNLGASIAIGDIFIFIDADIILDQYFLNEHIKRHHYLDNIVLVSFKENISPKERLFHDIIKGNNIRKPNIRKDFRFEKTVQKKWLRMHRHVRNVKVRNVKIIEETDNFKKFGGDKVLGVWDLPTMVITCAVSLKKKSFRNVGGFNLQFKGWGMEDTFLGACLIADGNYVVPCFSTGVFHINHITRSGFKQRKISEFNRNVLTYLDLINKPISKLFK